MHLLLFACYFVSHTMQHQWTFIPMHNDDVIFGLQLKHKCFVPVFQGGESIGFLVEDFPKLLLECCGSLRFGKAIVVAALGNPRWAHIPSACVLIQTGDRSIKFLVNFIAVKVERFDLWVPGVIVVEELEVGQTNDGVVILLVEDDPSRLSADGQSEIWGLAVVELDEVVVRFVTVDCDFEGLESGEAMVLKFML